MKIILDVLIKFDEASQIVHDPREVIVSPPSETSVFVRTFGATDEAFHRLIDIRKSQQHWNVGHRVLDVEELLQLSAGGDSP